MADSKKTSKDKGRTKAKKLQLNKETIKDLTAKRAEQVKGGIPKEALSRKYC